MQPAPDRPRAYSYLRMSTELQLKGDSRSRQLEASREYAEKNNLDFVQDFEFEDLGVSAYKGQNIQHGALGRFLTAISEGKIPRALIC